MEMVTEIQVEIHVENSFYVKFLFSIKNEVDDCTKV